MILHIESAHAVLLAVIGALLTTICLFLHPSTAQAEERADDRNPVRLPFVVASQAPLPPAFTSAPVTTGAVGVTYTYMVHTSGNPPPTVALGHRPNGMTIDEAGALHWTPATDGKYSVTILASNGILPDAEQTFEIDVAPGPAAPSVTSLSVLRATTDIHFTHPVQADGYPPPEIALVAGSAPEGMTIDRDGIIHWTPQSEGTYSATVRASNGVPPDAEHIIVIDVSPPVPPKITSKPVLAGTVGAPYAYHVEASGIPAPSISLDSAPPEMTVDASGLIEWTPTSAGVYAVSVRASNGADPDAVASYAIDVVKPPVSPAIISSPLLTGAVGDPYRYQIEAAGHPRPTIDLAAGPRGMSVDETGLIEWMPAASGDYAIIVRAANGVFPDAEQAFTVEVAPPPSPPAIISAPVVNGVANTLYTYQLAATGYPAPTFELYAAPYGMTVDDDGQIEWNPATAGAYSVTVRAVNGIMPNAEQTFTIDVSLPERIWDPDLDRRGASLIEASVPSGAGFWRLTIANWLNNYECGGKHNIFMDLVDDEGRKARSAVIRISWSGDGVDVAYADKPPDEFSWQFDMYAPAPAYNAQPRAGFADRVEGMGLGVEGDPWNHACYELTWQWTLMP